MTEISTTMALVLDAIEARAKAASPGPWRECGHDRGGCKCRLVWSIPLDMPIGVAKVEPEPGGTENTAEGMMSDARFIAAAREDVPALVARVRELEADAALRCDAMPLWRADVAARERERCAKVAEDAAPIVREAEFFGPREGAEALRSIAATIRALT